MRATGMWPSIKGASRLVLGAAAALALYSAARTQPLPVIPPIPDSKASAQPTEAVETSLPLHAPRSLPPVPEIPRTEIAPSLVPPIPPADYLPSPLPPIPPATPESAEPKSLAPPRLLPSGAPAPGDDHTAAGSPTSKRTRTEIIIPPPRYPIFQPAKAPSQAAPRTEPAPALAPPSAARPLTGSGPIPYPAMQPAGPSSTGFSTAAPAPVLAEQPLFDISWQNGVFFETADKNFSFHAGGAVHYDAAWYQATPILELAPGGTGRFHDGVNLRRGRFFMEGTFYQAVDYKFELEFANGFLPVGPGTALGAGNVTNSPGPTDAWITIKDVPLIGNVRIGSQKEWFSLEHLNSYKSLHFMERSYLFDFSQPTAFNNGFTPGISLFRTWADDRLFSAVGMYKNESDLLGFGVGDGEYAWTGRVAALPVWRPDDRMFWHVGGAMSQRDPVNDKVQIRIRDNIRNAPFPLLNLIANTGPIPTGSQDLYNLETAAVWGPLSFQAEYTANILNDTTAFAGLPSGKLFFQGYYAEVLWLLTGESRTWNTKNFFFNRVIPKNPLRFRRGDACAQRGCGAWELGVRYSYLDLSNRFVQAGRLDAVTVGLNWYLNANAKLQFNYDVAHRGDTDNAAQGTIHSLGTRCAFDF